MKDMMRIRMMMMKMTMMKIKCYLLYGLLLEALYKYHSIKIALMILSKKETDDYKKKNMTD
jgi:hypothetical protein